MDRMHVLWNIIANSAFRMISVNSVCLLIIHSIKPFSLDSVPMRSFELLLPAGLNELDYEKKCRLTINSLNPCFMWIRCTWRSISLKERRFYARLNSDLAGKLNRLPKMRRESMFMRRVSMGKKEHFQGHMQSHVMVGKVPFVALWGLAMSEMPRRQMHGWLACSIPFIFAFPISTQSMLAIDELGCIGQSTLIPTPEGFLLPWTAKMSLKCLSDPRILWRELIRKKSNVGWSNPLELIPKLKSWLIILGMLVKLLSLRGTKLVGFYLLVMQPICSLL